jgi:hypothetical protein
VSKKNLYLGGTLVALAVAFLVYCGNGSSTDTSAPPTVKDDPSFASDIQSIFNTSCISSGCHNAAGSAGLVLLSGQSYGNLVNVDSTQDNTKKRVLPNDANNSYLVIKIEGRQTIGGRMPLGGGALNSNAIQNIKNWINKGAKNN